MQILLKGLSKTVVISKQFSDINNLTTHISEITSIPTELFYLTKNGRLFTSFENNCINNTCILNINLKLLGGKGGFGSLLKGQAPVKKRTNNFDSCRDLSGRRLRHVNQEKMIHQWQQKKLEEDKFIEEHMNQEGEENLNDYLNNYKGMDLSNLEKKFQRDSVDTTNSISNSIKYLLKKRKKINDPNNNFKKVINIDNIVEEVETENNFITNCQNENTHKVVALSEMDKYKDIFDF